MKGERLARLSLRIDAIYCVVVGLLIAALALMGASAAELPALLLGATGMATTAWGGYVWWLGSHLPPTVSTRLVMIANIAASGLLAVTGVVADATVLAMAAAVLSVDVAAFAISQGIALIRMRPHHA